MLAVLAALPETREIVIENDWTGLSQEAPLELHYRLTRQGDDFVGPARSISGGYGNKVRATMAEVTVPGAAARAFFELLAQTPIRAGEYKSAVTHTDDYPSIHIVLETPAGRLVFGTASNSKGHVPWYVGVGTADFVTDSDTPNRALGLLDLSLDRGTGMVESPAGPDPLFCRTPAIPADPTGMPGSLLGEPDVNMAQQLKLAGLTEVSFDRGAKVTDPQQIAGLVTLFDRPIAPVGATYWSDYDTIELGLFFTQRDYVWLRYNPYLDLIYWQREPPASNEPIFTVAPPGFRELVLGEVCGR
jgi:hypothetical protein